MIITCNSKPYFALFFHCPIKINLRNWTSQATYNKCRQIYKTSNLSHHKWLILMRFHLIWTEAGARWCAYISSSQLIRFVGARLVKEHNYGSQSSSVPPSINSVSYPHFWCNIVCIPLQHIQLFLSPRIYCHYICTIMVVLSVTYKV